MEETSAGAHIPLLSVIGSGLTQPGDALYALAEQTGQLLARQGWGVVCGGRAGVMEAVCKGAAAGWPTGVRIGYLPGPDSAGANAYLNLILPTGLGEARNALVVRAGKGVIALGGGAGTLTEMGFAVKFSKPLFLLSGYGGASAQWAPQPPAFIPAERIHSFSTVQALENKLAALSRV